MARTEARVFTRIWHDEDFRALSAGAQRVYVVALSQPSLSFCGVVPYSPRRWAALAADTSPRAITRATTELADRRFVVIDQDTEELWIRTFTKNDGLLNSPNLRKAMAKDFTEIMSEPIRKGFLEGLPEGYRQELFERLPEPMADSCLLLLAPAPSPSDPLSAVTNAGRASVGQDNGFTKAKSEPLVLRLVHLCSGPKAQTLPESQAVIDRCQQVVDDRLIDECIGYCEGLTQRPTHPRYLLSRVKEQAEKHGIAVDEDFATWEPKRASA